MGKLSGTVVHPFLQTRGQVVINFYILLVSKLYLS